MQTSGLKTGSIPMFSKVKALDIDIPATLRGRANSTLAEIGEFLGFGGQSATRMAAKEVRAAVAALNAALGDGQRAAA
ncbi:hypothetical protein [Bradyrhizobium sp. JR4.1]|uniref:hypothetical protein n=1 Tax=Bradyrhizobium sp. JR4.1 TaxID=3156372 RepID=UPI0033948F6B